MKRLFLFCALALLAGPLRADSTGDDVNSAVKNLGDIGDYSWHSTFNDSEDSQSGSTDGQTAPDGFTYVTISVGGSSAEFVDKGEMVAITDEAGKWQPIAQLDAHQDANRFRLSLVRNFKTPAAQAAALVAAVGAFKKDGDLYSGVFTEDGANALLATEGGTATNSSGSVKFWITDGALTQYEFKVKGLVKTDGIDQQLSRDATVEIKYVGTTKVTMPNEAKSLFP
jgi:hypothetical protein